MKQEKIGSGLDYKFPIKKPPLLDDNHGVWPIPLEIYAVAEDGTIRIKCPSIGCMRVLAVPAHTRGKLVRCRQCGTIVRIPAVKQKQEPTHTSEENAA